MIWEVGRHYLTRGGLRAIIYATDASGPYPIHGAVYLDDSWILLKWNIEGMAISASLGFKVNLTPKHWIEPEKPKCWLAWASVSSYSLDIGSFYFSNNGPSLANDIRLPHLDPPESWQPVANGGDK